MIYDVRLDKPIEFFMELRFLDPITGKPIAEHNSREGTITIGRNPVCDVVIPAQYSTVSSLHATISSTGDLLKIIDGDGHTPSTNGLFLKGCKQATGIWLTLTPGMTLSFGKPGLPNSINLDILSNSGIPASSQSMHYAIEESQEIPSTGEVSEHHRTMHMDRASDNNVSEAMKLRLNAIDEHLSHGYTLQKDFGAFPVLIGSDNRRHNISIIKNPAGFSWIAFFFPFAVCTQIRVWSYFYVSSIVFIIAALIAVSTGYDPSISASIAMSLMYGLYFPYLRHMARARNVQEVSRGMSIIIGLLLSVLAAVPSYVIDIIADYAKN